MGWYDAQINCVPLNVAENTKIHRIYLLTVKPRWHLNSSK